MLKSLGVSRSGYRAFLNRKVSSTRQRKAAIKKQIQHIYDDTNPKKVQYVNEVFQDLKRTLGDFEFSRLFEVILTDNGTEFSDPESIELSAINGERLSNVFFCDPNASWQKGSIEKNHEYIRYVLPKGTSFAGLTQEDCNLLASHINSVPRKSLNNQSPFEAGQGFIGLDNITKLGISQIPYDDVNLSIRLLRK